MCKQHDQVFQVCRMQAREALVATAEQQAQQLHGMRAKIEDLQQQLHAQTGRNTVLGTRADCSLQGFDELQCKTTAVVCSMSDGSAELEQTVVLGRLSRQHSTQPVHDGTACSQEIEAVLKQLRGAVTGNAESDHDLLSQLRRVLGSAASSNASYLVGTPPPKAVLSRVQDTQGNSLIQEKRVDLDRSLSPQHKRLRTGSSDTASEQDAHPWSKPAAVMQAEAQAKATLAAKENSPVVANIRTGDPGAFQPTILYAVLHTSKLAASCTHVVPSPRVVRAAVQAYCTVMHAACTLVYCLSHTCSSFTGGMGQLFSASAAQKVCLAATVLAPNPTEQQRLMCKKCSEVTGKTVYRLGHCCAHFLKSEGKDPLDPKYAFVLGDYNNEENAAAAASASCKLPEECKLCLAQKLVEAEYNKRKREKRKKNLRSE